MLLLLLTGTQAVAGAPNASIASREVAVQGVGYGPRSIALQGFGLRAVSLAPTGKSAFGGSLRRRRVTRVQVKPLQKSDGEDDVLIFILWK